MIVLNKRNNQVTTRLLLKKGLRYIKENNVVDEKEIEGVKKILKAAAVTYIVATALAIVQFLSLFGMARRK